MTIHVETGNTQKTREIHRGTDVNSPQARSENNQIGEINLRTFESKLTFPLKIRTNA